MPTYDDAGVSRSAARETVERIKHVTRGMGQEVPGAGSLLEIGGFAAAVAPPHMREPVILSATDGVGTKLEIALRHGAYETIGIDCVAMCVNDLICHGADPLFFLDYLACGVLDPSVAERIVAGVAEGCRHAGCALVGGETAEMPGIYAAGTYDIAGFAVGMAERSALIDGTAVEIGDVLIGLPSSGLHSNGFSLVRHVLDDFEAHIPSTAARGTVKRGTIKEALLEPTRIYVEELRRIGTALHVHGAAHITGGGLPENVPRMWTAAGAGRERWGRKPLEDVAARIDKETLPDLPIFAYLAEKGISEEEMYATFNMGIGMVIALDAADAGTALESAEGARVIGEIVPSNAKGDSKSLWLE